MTCLAKEIMFNFILYIKQISIPNVRNCNINILYTKKLKCIPILCKVFLTYIFREALYSDLLGRIGYLESPIPLFEMKKLIVYRTCQLLGDLGDTSRRLTD